MKEMPIPAIKVTWGMAIRVWWAFTWRVLISLAFGAALAGFFIKFGPQYLHIKKSTAILYSSIACGIYLIFINIIFIKTILNKRFKGFSVVVIKTR